MGELLKLLASAALIEARKAVKAWIRERQAPTERGTPLPWKDVKRINDFANVPEANKLGRNAPSGAKVSATPDRSEP